MKANDQGYVRIKDIRSIVEASRKEFRKVSAKALDTGSAVHAAIERYIKTGDEPQAPSDQVLSAFLAFLEWQEKYQVKAINTEQTLYGDNFAGTCDLICTMVVDGKPLKYLVDFKASKGVYEEMKYQIAAYRSLTDCKGCGILRLDKETGLPEWVDTSSTYEHDLRVFKLLADLWWARKENGNG